MMMMMMIKLTTLFNVEKMVGRREEINESKMLTKRIAFT